MTIKIKSEEARTRWRDMMDAAQMGEAIVIERYNTPQAALISYEAYLALQEEIEELQADQRAIEIYEKWKRDPSSAIPWDEAKAQMIADGLIDG